MGKDTRKILQMECTNCERLRIEIIEQNRGIERLRNDLGYTELELENKKKAVDILRQAIRDIKNSIEALTRNL